MSTAIEWTDETWNPIRTRDGETGKLGWHCHKVSAGCANCYAEGFNNRFGNGLPFKPAVVGQAQIHVEEKTLEIPLGWKTPRRIFVCSMTDLFAPFHTDAIIDKVFAIIAQCRWHTFQILTKRPARARDYLAGLADGLTRGERLVHALFPEADFLDGSPDEKMLHDQARRLWPFQNVWLGTSVEHQAAADERVPILLDTLAAVRFLSAEPLLGMVDLTWLVPQDDTTDDPLDALAGRHWTDEVEGGTLSRSWRQDAAGLHHLWRRFRGAPRARIDWVIAGGESGRDARPMHPNWVRALRDQCAANGTAFFFKQWGEWAADEIGPEEPRALTHPPGDVRFVRLGKKHTGRTFEGLTHSEFPA